MSLRVVYMGTPDFAVPALEALASDKRVQLCLVVSQPDREAGRGKKIQRTPVAACADRLQIPTYQPETLRTPAAEDRLRQTQADLFIVAAYGQILRQDVLDMPTMGCVNLHASLLPRWRGAAPIQWAVAAGDAVTGISLMRMEAGLDTGPVYAQRALMIGEAETASELHDRLASASAALLIDELDRITDPSVVPVPQNADRHTYARTLSVRDRTLDFHQSAQRIAWTINGMSTWPGARCLIDDVPMKLLRAAPSTFDVPPNTEPGTILIADRDHGLHIAGGDGHGVAILDIQRPGKKSMSAAALLQGYPLDVGLVVQPYHP